MLNKKVASFIRQQQLLKSDGRYLVALSGGADSVCLLLVLKQLGYFIEAIHCNFHLRGEESDRDELFCQNLCAQKQIPLHLVHFDTHEYAQLHKVSIEMAARQLRYRHFAQLCQDLQMDGICVAHHQDDVAETVLMNLIRGTGLKGLSGIRSHQELSFVVQNAFQGEENKQILHVFRPLLCVLRDEIEAFLKETGQDYVTDSTNMVADVLRNKIRLQVLPLLDEIAPSASKNIVETAENVAFADEYLEQKVGEDLLEMLGEEPLMDASKPHSIPIEKVGNEYVLYRILTQFGFVSPQIKQIYAHLDAPTGTEFRSETHVLVLDRGQLLIEEQEQHPFREMKIPEEGTYRIGEQVKIKIERFHREDSYEIPREKTKVALDASEISFPLILRRLREADRFHPFGMKGSKLVSDYLTDQKRSLLDKRRQLVITDAQDRILWLIGERPDDRFRITVATTEILQLSI